MSVSYKGRYLSAQYKLLSIQSSDLMTDEEAAIFRSLLEIKQKINAAETKEEKTKFVNEKKAASKRMNEMIAAHEGPRRLNPACVCDTRSFVDGQPPDYISWDNVKETRRIQEFCSEESRILGVEKDSVFLGKIIMAWKTIEILEQVVINGLIVPLLDPETGEIKDVPYRFHTASAGQLRRDKVQLLSCEAYDKMYDSAYCGLHWDEINEHGGINVNKLLAYYGLPASATERWKLLDGTDMDIDRCIVAPDFEATVTDMLEYIDQDYVNDKRVQTVKINHCDGIGMILPELSKASDPRSDNAIVRGPWLKGLLTTFDFIKFCERNNCPAKITDVWGKEHDLIEENIQVVFTESQLKLWKYYKDWDDYKTRFKKYNCHLCRTNYEEPYIKDSPANYQFLETLVAMTDEQIDHICQPDLDRINNLGTTRQGMLQVLGAEDETRIKTGYQHCLHDYPPLLRDSYARETIKDVKRAWTLNAKSGVLNLKNKRLYAIPDMYAACERWFLGIEQPEGILPNGVIWTNEKTYKPGQKLDLLRSPH